MTDIATMVTNAVRAHSMNSARTAQSDDNRLGASEIGMCRSYLQRMILQEEKREEESLPWAAFIGTALGDSLERAVAADNPEVILQADVTATLPSGYSIPGHVDAYLPVQWSDAPGSRITDPGWVLDFKAKDGLALMRREEPDRAHVYQIVLYWLALVQAEAIPGDAKAFIVYVDRSGKDPNPEVKEIEDPASYIPEIDEWLGDAIYAVTNGVDAPRDRPYQWCEVACPFFWNCRGADEFHAEGLIENPEHLAAVALYQEGLEIEKKGKAIKQQGRDALVGVAGSTGEVVVSWTHINPTEYITVREGYDRMNVRRLRPTKGSTP